MIIWNGSIAHQMMLHGVERVWLCPYIDGFSAPMLIAGILRKLPIRWTAACSWW